MTDYEIGGGGAGGAGAAITISGNTAGGGAIVSSGTLSLGGGANITLSQVGNAITIIGGAGGAGFTGGVSTFGNTAGTTGVVANQLVLVGTSNITLSQSSAAGGATVSILGVASQTLQTQNRFNLTLSGNTAGALAAVSSGTLTLAGGNNITLSQAGNAVTISGPNTAAQSVQTQNAVDVTLAGNTLGALALVSSGTMTLAGGDNITLSQAGNAVTIVGPAPGVGVGGTFTMGASNLGNTSGTSGVIVGSNLQFILVGGNRVTISQSLDLLSTAATLTISAGNQSVQTQNLIAATLDGNTAGALALVSSGTLTLAGGPNITLSQAGNAVTISAAAAGGAGPSPIWWENGAIGQSTLSVQFHSSNWSRPIFFPLARAPFPANMTISTLGMRFAGAVTGSGNSVAHSLTFAFGLYTLNGQTLSMLNSAITTIAMAATPDNSASYNGGRLLTVHSSQWSAAPVVSAGVNYWWCLSYEVNALMPGSFSYYPLRFNDVFQYSGTVGVSAAATATSMGPRPFIGQYSTVTAALPTAVENSELNKGNTVAFHAPPSILFNNIVSNF